MSENVEWVNLASVEEIPQPGAIKVDVDDLVICLAKDSNGVIHALDDTCTHAAVSLSEGEVDDDGIVVHEYDDTPEGFGRIAATTARQVILQRLRDAEHERLRCHGGAGGRAATGGGRHLLVGRGPDRRARAAASRRGRAGAEHLVDLAEVESHRVGERERLAGGASLVQGYTGFIYGGIGLEHYGIGSFCHQLCTFRIPAARWGSNLEARRALAAQLIDAPFSHHMPLRHNAHAVTQALHQVQLVRGENDGHATVGALAQHI